MPLRYTQRRQLAGPAAAGPCHALRCACLLPTYFKLAAHRTASRTAPSMEIAPAGPSISSEIIIDRLSLKPETR